VLLEEEDDAGEETSVQFRDRVFLWFIVRVLGATDAGLKFGPRRKCSLSLLTPDEDTHKSVDDFWQILYSNRVVYTPRRTPPPRHARMLGRVR
jgi:hypothetical protein